MQRKQISLGLEMFQGSGSEQSGVCPCQALVEAGKGFISCLPGVSPYRVLFCEVCPYACWDVLCAWFTEGQVSSPAKLGEEPSVLTQCSFLQQQAISIWASLYKAASGQAQETGNLKEFREKRSWKKPSGFFLFLRVNLLAQDTQSVSCT